MTTQPDVQTLVAVNAIISFAEQLPVTTLTTQNSEPVYPVTTGELIVSHTLGLILSHSWADNNHELAIAEIKSLLSGLDMGIDNEQNWNDLFKANTQLNNYIQKIQMPR
jgi:hypothetical protein